MDEEIIALVGIIMVFGAPLVGIVLTRAFKACENVVKHYNETRLKLKMVERGYSVAEIERLCTLPVDHHQLNNAWSVVGPEKAVRA